MPRASTFIRMRLRSGSANKYASRRLWSRSPRNWRSLRQSTWLRIKPWHFPHQTRLRTHEEQTDDENTSHTASKPTKTQDLTGCLVIHFPNDNRARQKGSEKLSPSTCHLIIIPEVRLVRQSLTRHPSPNQMPASDLRGPRWWRIGLLQLVGAKNP